MGALGVVRGNGDLELALTIRTFAIAEGGSTSGSAAGSSGTRSRRPRSRSRGRRRGRCSPRSARRSRRERVTLLARRGRRPRRRRSGRAGAARGRRGAPARPRRVRDDARLRRRAVQARPSTSTGSAARPSGSACRAVTGSSSSSWRSRRSPQPATPDAVLRLYWTPERRSSIALVSALADHSTTLRERGQRLVSLLGVRADVPVAARRREVDELRGQHGGRGGGPAARRRRRVFVDADGARARGPDDERLVAARAHALHALARPRHPRRRHARDRARARRASAATRSRRAASRLTSSAAADEAFTSSSVRELMPVVELDGAPIARGPAADELQAALRRAAEGYASRHDRQASSRRDGALERRARARPDVLGLRGPDRPTATMKVAAARKRLFAPDVQHPFLRGPLRLAEAFALLPARAEAARGEAAVRAAAVLAATLASALDRPGRAPFARLGAAARELAVGLALARARDAGAARRRARRLPRRRAHLDRDVRARREAREGARALRLAPGRPAARDVGRRQLLASRAPAHLRRPRADRELDRRGRRRRRGLRAG